MKINKYLLVTISPLLLVCCANNKKLPKRKDGDTCNITFKGNVDGLTCDNPSTVKINNDGKDLKLHLSIPYIADPNTDEWGVQPTMTEDGELYPRNVAYNVNVGDITINIGGEKFDESFTYFGETNNKNILTIDKDYIVNDIEINVTARDRGKLFLFGYEFGKEIEDRIDYSELKDDSTKDIVIEFASKYQNKKVPINTLDRETFPVFEDDSIDLTISVKDSSNVPLPNNIWLRTNARYASLDNDFTREYSDDYKICHLKVPNYVVRDHGAFLQFDME